MSEQQGETVSGETGSIGAGSAAGEPVSAQVATEVASPGIAPDQEETAPKADAPKVETSKAEAPKVELSKVDAAKAEEPRFPGKMLIMARDHRAWEDEHEAEIKAETTGKRRYALAAVVALATVAGALGGALATAGYGHFAGGDESVTAKNSALEATVARLDADMLALKASVEHTAKTGISQFNKTSDRLDKVEKAQAEPAAKIAKLSEAVDKLRATPPATVAAAPAATRDITGSVTPPATTAAVTPAQAAAAKPEIGRLPTVEGWVLRDVANGGALIEGRRGLYEVYAGDPIPGVGRVDAIRKQDGRWVVVTNKGLIVSR